MMVNPEPRRSDRNPAVKDRPQQTTTLSDMKHLVYLQNHRGRETLMARCKTRAIAYNCLRYIIKNKGAGYSGRVAFLESDEVFF